MMDGAHARHALALPLEVADGDEFDLGKEMVDLAEVLFVHVVHGVHEFVFHKAA